MITPRIRTPGSWIPIQQPNPLGSGPWILGPDPETLVLDPGFWVRTQKPWFRTLDFGSGPRNLGSGPWILGPDPETLVPDPGFWVRFNQPAIPAASPDRPSAPGTRRPHRRRPSLSLKRGLP